MTGKRPQLSAIPQGRVPNIIAKLWLLSNSWAHKAGLYSTSVSLTFFITVYHCL